MPVPAPVIRATFTPGAHLMEPPVEPDLAAPDRAEQVRRGRPSATFQPRAGRPARGRAQKHEVGVERGRWCGSSCRRRTAAGRPAKRQALEQERHALVAAHLHRAAAQRRGSCACRGPASGPGRRPPRAWRWCRRGGPAGSSDRSSGHLRAGRGVGRPPRERPASRAPSRCVAGTPCCPCAGRRRSAHEELGGAALRLRQRRDAPGVRHGHEGRRGQPAAQRLGVLQRRARPRARRPAAASATATARRRPAPAGRASARAGQDRQPAWPTAADGAQAAAPNGVVASRPSARRAAVSSTRRAASSAAVALQGAAGRRRAPPGPAPSSASRRGRRPRRPGAAQRRGVAGAQRATGGVELAQHARVAVAARPRGRRAPSRPGGRASAARGAWPARRAAPAASPRTAAQPLLASQTARSTRRYGGRARSPPGVEPVASTGPSSTSERSRSGWRAAKAWPTTVP